MFGRLIQLAVGVILGATLWADTIVLKNGRRIIAESVFEEGDKVVYEDETGRVSLPTSLVERVERGGAVPDRSPSSSFETPSEHPLAQELSRQIQLPS
ncbi:MAG: hypothetical protein HY647_03715 [Acidobacteria bacterium]|nr:hypothetical protein [Acidobacteriota bacterium]